MRVLLINSVCGYGSTGNIVVDLYRELRAQGHECCVAYGRGTAPEDVQTYRIGSDRDVYVHGVMSRLTDRHGFYSKAVTRRFVQWMKAYDPDVIHLHNLHGYYINIAILFAALKEMDKPVVWTLHDCWAYTGHCSHYTYMECYRWTHGCRHCIQKRQYPASLLLSNSARNYKKKKEIFCGVNHLCIVTPSEWLAYDVAKSFLIDYPVITIYNGIDLRVFCPTQKHLKERYGLQDKKIILGVASEWGERKGLQDFVYLSKRLPDEYHIVLIGRIRGKKPERSNITYIDRTSDRSELAGWYTEAEVFFNPTYEDTYPTVNLEAQACGTPVITYNTGGSPEGVDKSSGAVIPPRSSQWVLKVMETLKTPVNQQNIKNLSKENMIQAYMELYAKQQ